MSRMLLRTKSRSEAQARLLKAKNEGSTGAEIRTVKGATPADQTYEVYDGPAVEPKRT